MRLGVSVVAVFVVVGLSGCPARNNSNPSGKGPDAAPGIAPIEEAGVDAGPYAAGRKVFDNNRCKQCHATSGLGNLAPGGPPGGPPAGPPGGPGGPPKMGGGPNLSTIGARHDADWIAAHVRDPQSHKPGSKMPKYPEGKINDADLKALADYLASLK